MKMGFKQMEKASMKVRFVLLAVIMFIIFGVIYINNSWHTPAEENLDLIMTEPANQQLEIKPNKMLYRLEAREYDETAVDNGLMERALANIESFPKNSEFGPPSLEDELAREWLKKTSIFSISTQEDETDLINNYLKQQGISKTIPDSVTECAGNSRIRYYRDDKSGKIAFVSTVSDSTSFSKNVYCGIVYSQDFEKYGSLLYDFDSEGKILSEKFYNNQSEQETAVSYRYDTRIPFPIITNYNSILGEDGSFYANPYLNIGQRFWVYEDLIEFDENNKWVRYNGDIYHDYSSEDDIESYQIPVYDQEDRLERIDEYLRGSRYQDNPEEWVEDGVIGFTYNESGSLVQVDYSGFSGNHGSSGNSGSAFYDESGRIIHINSFHSSGNYHYFYLYSGDEKNPFAIFRIGGMPHSDDEFAGYPMLFGMDFDAWLLSEQN